MSDVEVTGGREWIAALDAAIKTAPAETVKVVSRGSLQIKKAWQRRWKGHPHISHLPYTINYDIKSAWHTVSGEIGPDRDRGGQAPLAGIIEYGSPTSPPMPGGLPSLAEEAPRFEKALEDMAVKLLGD